MTVGLPWCLSSQIYVMETQKYSFVTFLDICMAQVVEIHLSVYPSRIVVITIADDLAMPVATTSAI